MIENRIKVLLVEDNPSDARLVREFLTEEGDPSFELAHEAQLGRALDLLGKEQFDALLLDLMLPDSDTMDTLGLSLTRAPRIPIVVLTGTDDESVAAWAIRQGAQDYLVKRRFGGSLLRQTIRNAIERRRLGERLIEVQRYALSLIDSSLDMIISVDRERRIVEFNPAAEATFGYSRSDVLGKHIDALYADPLEGQTIHQRVLGAGRCTAEVINVRRNGETFPSLLAASPLRNSRGDLLGVMGVSRDITERKEAEEALRTSEQEARRLAHQESVMAEIGRTIGSSLDLERVYERFAEEVRKVVPFDRIAINAVDEERGVFIDAYRMGVDVAERHFERDTPMAGSVAEEVIRTRSALLIHVENADEGAGRFPFLAPHHREQ